MRCPVYRRTKENKTKNIVQRDIPKLYSQSNQEATLGPGDYHPYFNEFNPESGQPEDSFIPKDYDIQPPKYSITGKPTGNRMLGPLNDDNKFSVLEQSLSYLSKNNGELPKLSDYNTVKDAFPNFSFPRSQRFSEKVNSQFPAPNEYFKETDIEKLEREFLKNSNMRL